ncbi:acyl-CoA synthetase [Mycolicibacterium phlei]
MAGRTESDRTRSEDDDHDLLTFGEAGERLRLEIADAERTVEECRTAGSEALRKAEQRLEALRAAAQRNSAQPINDENFEKFFGYPGKATRNPPTGGSH